MGPKAKIGMGALLAAVILAFGVGVIRRAGINPFNSHADNKPSAIMAVTPPDPRFATHVFLTADSGYHNTGRRDGLGWAATPQDHHPDHMNFGPYTAMIAPGGNVASFRLMVDDIAADNENVVWLDVNDSTADRVIADVPVTRGQFAKPMVYQDFDLPFVAPDHDVLEFRTYYLGKAYVNQERVTVTLHPSSTWIFPTAESPFHRIGHKTELGWSVSGQEPANDFLNYGPYARVLQLGPAVATFQLMLQDGAMKDDANIVNLDVNDADDNKVIAMRPIARRDFKKLGVFQDFDLRFEAPRHHRLEFRTFRLVNSGTVIQQQVSVAPLIPGLPR